MAYNVALFQLGMDLDHGSSTAQTEEKHSVCGPSVAQQHDRKDYFCVRDGRKFAGTHLIVDVKNGSRLDDLEHIENTFRKCIEVAGATLLHIHMHHFTPNGGVSGVAVLAESHISIHSWPEYGYAALDIFMCGDTKPHLALDIIREAFQPDELIVQECMRGENVAIAA
ncbi:MAG: adenosylmethionine decarboxylase [Rhodomicrobiaceae bacterium]